MSNPRQLSQSRRSVMCENETRVAVMGIIVENRESAGALNQLLHEYGGYIIGRMGIPYKEKGVSIISVAIDAPQNVTAALSGKIGRLRGVSVKTAYSNVVSDAIPEASHGSPCM